MKAKSTKGFSLLIGLNEVDPDHYGGWYGKLDCCERDVEGIAQIAKKEGYENIETLLTKNATRENVLQSLQKAADIVNTGDTFLLYYSGHGSFLKDENSEEEDDRQDETWCLYDGQMLDDEIYSYWGKFKKDVKVLMISDSCHSGTMFKALADNEYYIPKIMPFDVREKVFKSNKDFYISLMDKKRTRNKTGEIIPASILLLSACQDNQQAMAGYNNSLFTHTLIELHNSSRAMNNYEEYFLLVKEKINRIQNPNYAKLGVENKSFESQKPFEII